MPDVSVSLFVFPQVENLSMSEKRMITEIKYAPGHTEKSWECEVVEMDPPKWARIRYVADRDYDADGVKIPVGTVTDAMYWNDRPYHVWRFTDPDGTIIGYRFDICMNTHIWRTKLIWTDLGYDLWVPNGGEAEWKDIDEVQELLRREHLSPEEAKIGDDGRERLDREWKDVIEDVYGVRW